jgi:hypothetical protein
MQPKFQPTIVLDKSTKASLKAGITQLRPGQWVQDPKTQRKGRFIKIGSNGNVSACWHGERENFFGYAWRHAEACWHQYRKQHSPTLCVLGAPTATVTLAEVKRNVRRFFTGGKRVYGG